MIERWSDGTKDLNRCDLQRNVVVQRHQGFRRGAGAGEKAGAAQILYTITCFATAPEGVAH
jgi:hypothetical protein